MPRLLLLTTYLENEAVFNKEAATQAQQSQNMLADVPGCASDTLVVEGSFCIYNYVYTSYTKKCHTDWCGLD